MPVTGRCQPNIVLQEHIYVLLAVVRNAAKVSQPFIDDFGASGFDDTHDIA